MKLFPLIIVLLCLEIGWQLFYGALAGNISPEQIVLGYNGTVNTQNQTTPGMWNFIYNPYSWTSSDLFSTLSSILIVAGIITIGAGLLFKNDLVILFSFFLWLLGFGSIPITHLYSMVQSEVARYGCKGVISSCTVATLAGAVTAGLLGLAWVVACLAWWSARETT